MMWGDHTAEIFPHLAWSTAWQIQDTELRNPYQFAGSDPKPDPKLVERFNVKNEFGEPTCRYLQAKTSTGTISNEINLKDGERNLSLDMNYSCDPKLANKTFWIQNKLKKKDPNQNISGIRHTD